MIKDEIVDRRILVSIVFAQFCGTSLWFASNGVMNDLIEVFALSDTAIGSLTSSVQLGFIFGTLVFAILGLVDRISPSTLFFCCSILGGIVNLAFLYESHTISSLLFVRFVTGICLAGIYPVGMKIASDYYRSGLGKSLGFLVGALVLGTALPHFLSGIEAGWEWKLVLKVISGLSFAGGLIMLLFVGDGPYCRKSPKVDWMGFITVFKVPKFRAASFGYFGHMWELYAFWTFVPLVSNWYFSRLGSTLNPSLFSFAVIASGVLGCVAAGYLSERIGTAKVAVSSLALSGICCLLSPVILSVDSVGLFAVFMIFWGIVVIADSPLFSSLVANGATAKNKGTGITIVTSIGFAITIVSIQWLASLQDQVDLRYLFLILIIGPIFGLFGMRKSIQEI